MPLRTFQLKLTCLQSRQTHLLRVYLKLTSLQCQQTPRRMCQQFQKTYQHPWRAFQTHQATWQTSLVAWQTHQMTGADSQEDGQVDFGLPLSALQAGIEEEDQLKEGRKASCPEQLRRRRLTIVTLYNARRRL